MKDHQFKYTHIHTKATKEKKRTKPQMQLYYSVAKEFCMKSYDGKGYETHLQRV